MQANPRIREVRDRASDAPSSTYEQACHGWRPWMGPSIVEFYPWAVWPALVTPILIAVELIALQVVAS